MFILHALPFSRQRSKSLSPRRRGFDSFHAHLTGQGGGVEWNGKFLTHVGFNSRINPDIV